MSMVRVIYIPTGKPKEFTQEAWKALKDSSRGKDYKLAPEKAKIAPPPELKELEDSKPIQEPETPVKRKRGRNNSNK